MGAVSPGFRPPAPPRRSGGHLIIIALLVVVLIVVTAIFALIFGARMISHNISIHEQRSSSGKKVVNVQTPVGSINIHEGEPVDAVELGLPVYPGARQIRGHGVPRVWVDFPGLESVDVVAAHFETPDSIRAVQDYYQRQLNGHIAQFSDNDYNGKAIIRIKQGNQEKVVALRSGGHGTEITLLRVLHGSGEAN